MKRGATNLGEFWIGRHLNLGFVAFDPEFQQATNDTWVRLFVIAEGRWGLFTREKARVEVSGPMSDSEFQQATTAWLATRGRLLPLLNRKAHCHSCTASLEAWSSPNCLECNWMKCSCGSCGCDR